MQPVHSAFRSVAVALLLIPVACPQTDQASTDTPRTESILIDLVKNTPDPESQLKLLNAMVKALPNESPPWAYEQIFRVFEETGQLDRALETGEKILSIDRQDIEIAYKSLRIAERKGDPALVRKWSQIATRTAANVVSSPKDDEIGRRRMEYARQVGDSLGYLKYREIAAVPDASKKIELLEDFLQRNRDSEYRHAAATLYLVTCRGLGDGRKTLSAAEKILKWDENNEDALLVLAESYQDSQIDPQKLIGYSNRILAVMNRRAKPVELTDAEWTKKKTRLTGASYWMIGSALLQQNHYGAADKSIRTALPYLKGDTRLTSAALFYLGWANYQMHNFPDAIRFNQQCLTLKGPYQDKAARNLQVIRAESDQSTPNPAPASHFR
jgi:tetratricopeptide (TPR) repeat protein